MSRLSVVIPTYNTAAMTLACARAARAAAPEAEIVIVDDASSDETTSLLAAEGFRVLRRATNGRFAAAANDGVAATSGEIVLLLNSDALLSSVAPLLAAFDADPRLGVAGARLLNPDGTPQWSGGPLPSLVWLFVMSAGIARFLPRRNRGGGAGAIAAIGWVSGAAMAFRREVWAAAGPLSERYRFYAQDLEFCAAARAAGWKVALVGDFRVVHAGGATLRDPSLLTLDLLTWARAHHGPVWAAIAGLLMRAGALLRKLFVKGDEAPRQDIGGVTRGDEPPSGGADRGGL